MKKAAKGSTPAAPILARWSSVRILCCRRSCTASPKSGAASEGNRFRLLKKDADTKAKTTPPLGLYIPTELNGEAGKAIFEATHKDDDAILYWHIDDDYIGSTESFHQVEVRPSLGAHTLRVIDQKGRSIKRTFYILNER